MNKVKNMALLGAWSISWRLAAGSGMPGVRRLCWRLALLVCLCGLVHVPVARGDQNSFPLPEETGRQYAAAAQQWLRGLGVVSGEWQAVQFLSWFGVPLWLRQFTLTQNLDEAALELTRIAPALVRVLTGPDTLLLSGGAGRLHMVVQLQKSAQGVRGFASAMALLPPGQGLAISAPEPVLAWLAQNAPVHASQWQLPDGRQVRQLVYTLAQPAAQLRERLRITLEQQGWQETSALTHENGARWQRRADYIELMENRSGQGSVLYQILVSGGSS